MTRNPNRIRPILDTIEQIWMRQPNQRLGQLILNACVQEPINKHYGPQRIFQEVSDIFYFEDDDLLRYLKHYLNVLQNEGY